MTTPQRPAALTGAFAGSLLLVAVAFAMLVTRSPWNIGIAAAILAYVVSVWALASGWFGSWTMPLHTALAVPVVAAAVGAMGMPWALLVAAGLLGNEIYCSHRQPVAGLRAS